MEQPTIFYVVVAVLAIAGESSALSLAAAWGYAGIRIVHSLWQGLVNLLPVWVTLFLLSTGCLWALAVDAARVTLF